MSSYPSRVAMDSFAWREISSAFVTTTEDDMMARRRLKSPVVSCVPPLLEFIMVKLLLRSSLERVVLLLLVVVFNCFQKIISKRFQTLFFLCVTYLVNCIDVVIRSQFVVQ
jgi:hypothetical protein